MVWCAPSSYGCTRESTKKINFYYLISHQNLERFKLFRNIYKKKFFFLTSLKIFLKILTYFCLIWLFQEGKNKFNTSSRHSIRASPPPQPRQVTPHRSPIRQPRWSTRHLATPQQRTTVTQTPTGGIPPWRMRTSLVPSTHRITPRAPTRTNTTSLGTRPARFLQT